MSEPGEHIVVDVVRERLRAADADRERVAEQLRRAHAEGRLDLAEYDERVQAAWAARTYGDLAVITTDLPALLAAPAAATTWPEPAPRIDADVSDRGGALGVWAFASVLNVGIWAIIGLATTSWVYPWWIWVVGPWGAVLLAHRVAERWRDPGRFGRRPGTTYTV